VLVAEGVDISLNEDKWYLERLDGGLFTLQNIDYILAWIAMEDDGVSLAVFFLIPLAINKQPQYQARAHLMQMLDRKSKSVKDIIRTLQEYHDNVDEGDHAPSDKEGSDRAPSKREILQGLIMFLESC
jgi:beta-catenin-like protein 1